ncbi:hypothetical protein WA026_012793 [Henosepilachna vigintioctopunctata]|uniref:Retrotransposon gag domain-containing protein n=1 Tax=Henosepilachna vigintioctopunctata TaxID=420089 RepID=A0AAW1U982_9CUCU
MNSHNLGVNFSTKEQLNYELKIRGVITIKEFHRKSVILARLLEQEKKRNIDVKSFIDPEYSSDSETVVITASFAKINELLEEFEGTDKDSDFVRILNYIIHTYFRIERIVIPEQDVGNLIKNFELESHASALEFEAILFEKLKTMILIYNQIMFLYLLQFLRFCLPTPLYMMSQKKSLPVYQRNLTYSGNKNESLFPFLSRVEKYCKSRNVTKSELFVCAAELFSGAALYWFRSVESKVRDWNSLVNLLKEQFLP